MNDLPKLVKPYYSIEESFKRLKIAGAHLDQINDVFLLGQNDLIEISLLCDELTHLVGVEYAKPIKSSRKKLINREKEEWSNYDCLPEEFDQYMNEIEEADWIIVADILTTQFIERIGNNIGFLKSKEERTHNLLSKIFHKFGINPQDHEEVLSPENIDVNHHDITTVSCWNGIVSPFLIKPLNLGLIWENHNGTSVPKYKKSHWLALNRNGRVFESLVVVDIEGRQFYVCKDMEFNPLIDRVQLQIPDVMLSKYNPTYALDNELVENLIQKDNFVISKIDLQKFEQRHLGVDHEITLDNTPEYLDKSSEFYAEELDIAIQAHKAIFVEKYGNQHQSNSSRISSWLSKNYPEKYKVDAFVKRITAIVLPKKG